MIPRGQGDTALDLLWRQINNPLIWVLLGSAVVAMALDPTDGVTNGLVVLAVVVLNSLIGFVQEFTRRPGDRGAARHGPGVRHRPARRAPDTVAAADLVPGDVRRSWPPATRCRRTCA